jgi:4-amino-4-deoxy-L-arabinose transferase-like glycosyltransferase
VKAFPYFSDIRFWIVVFFIIRLIGITNPPLEVEHNWRQTTVTMVARNFLEVDNNIFYPRVDFAGDKTGITGMEFPLLNYMIYGTAEIFGYQHWYGRLINLIASSFGLWFFYRLVSLFFKESVSFYATLVLSVSIWFQFSRKIMPDTFAMSLIIAGIYYGFKFLKSQNPLVVKKEALLYFLLILLGVLAKLPSGYLLIVFVFPIFDSTIAVQRKVLFVCISGLVLVPAVCWYFYWVPFLVETYGFWHFFMGKSITMGFQEIITNGQATAQKFYDTALKFIGFGLFVWGMLTAYQQKEKRIFWILTVTICSFSIVILKAGYTFPHHSYYIIPFVPVMALVAGFGLSSIDNKKVRIFLMTAIVIEGIANQQHDFFLKPSSQHLLNLESDLNQISQPNDLIAINSGDVPTPMYFSHRKGWILNQEDLLNVSYLEDLKSKGVKFVVVLNNNQTNFNPNLLGQLIMKKEGYSIYSK